MPLQNLSGVAIFAFLQECENVGMWECGNVCLLLSRFDSAGEAGELEARETGDEHARDHGKEERREAKRLQEFVSFSCQFCRFLGKVLFPSF